MSRRLGSTSGTIALLIGAILAGFLALWTLALIYAVFNKAQGQENSPAPAQRAPLARLSCAMVRKYVAEAGGEREARARAMEQSIPTAVIERAERCLKGTAK